MSRETRLEGVESYRDVVAIYNEAFPKAEHKPNIMMKHRIKKGIYELFVLRDGGKAVAFITAVTYKDVVMFDYLAVNNSIRGKGYGTEILNDVVAHYDGKRIFLVAEEIGEQYANNEQRMRRMEFYRRNGWQDSGMVSVGSSGRLSVLTHGGDITAEEYVAIQTKALGRCLMRLSKLHIEYR